MILAVIGVSKACFTSHIGVTGVQFGNLAARKPSKGRSLIRIAPKAPAWTLPRLGEQRYGAGNIRRPHVVVLNLIALERHSHEFAHRHG